MNTDIISLANDLIRASEYFSDALECDYEENQEFTVVVMSDDVTCLRKSREALMFALKDE